MYSNENDLVFDGYLGSGTTAAACLVENRRFIGSELKAEYFSIVERRIKKIKNTPTLFNGDSKVA
jgi:site-specific DNA-methyltransferase (adenine-specific)